MTFPPLDGSKPLQDLETDEALRAILQGTATETGQGFFAALVQNLSKALGTHGAWVTEYFPETRRLRALAFWMDGQWVKEYEVDIAGTPCEHVIDTAKLVHFPDRILQIYPHNDDLKAAGAVSYMGVPLQDTDGHILGHMAVIDRRPIPEEPRVHAIFQIFAARAAAELQRLRAEAEVREREEKVGRLLSSAMDAIIELDDELHITRVNPATERAFRCRAETMTGQNFRRFVSPDDAGRLVALVAELDGRPEGQQSRWIPGGLAARCPDGDVFPAEATLSRFELHRRKFTTLILRNVLDRVEAEQKIRSLTAETELLREELQGLHHDEALIGESQALQQVLRDIGQVAETDATVLILGETGTGKELVARAIHALSGEIATRHGDLEAGINHFREAVKIEDAGLYFEPPKWYYPIRHSLGAALVKAGRNAEAEKVYREDLRRFPENGWSLFGLAQALRAQRKNAEADAVEARFRRAWASTDVTLTASRL